MLDSRNWSPTEETREAREARRARLKKIYDSVLKRHDQAVQSVERTYRRNLWLSAFATIISPLSLIVTIQFIRAPEVKKASFGRKALLVVLALVPFLSGFLSWAAAIGKKQRSEPKMPPVRKVRMAGKPEEVKKQLKNQAIDFERKYGGILLNALKNFGKGNPQELENSMQGYKYKNVTDVRTEKVKVPPPKIEETQTENIVYKATEEMPPVTFKPSKIFVAVPGKDETDVYLEEEQDTRRKIRAGEMPEHAITVNENNNQPAYKISFAPRSFLGAGESELAGTFFFWRSIVRSTQNVAQMEAEYEAEERLRLR